jgi:hypothetical protein
MQLLDGDKITYPRSAILPALCISSSEEASLDLVPCLEASHAVHLPRRIDVRPSVTALVWGPRNLYLILRYEMSPVGACIGMGCRGGLRGASVARSGNVEDRVESIKMWTVIVERRWKSIRRIKRVLKSPPPWTNKGCLARFWSLRCYKICRRAEATRLMESETVGIGVCGDGDG